MRYRHHEESLTNRIIEAWKQGRDEKNHLTPTPTTPESLPVLIICGFGCGCDEHPYEDCLMESCLDDLQ